MTASAAELLRSTELIVYDQRAEVARHQRLAGKGTETLILDHYLGRR
jgi:hypothetical protein